MQKNKDNSVSGLLFGQLASLCNMILRVEIPFHGDITLPTGVLTCLTEQHHFG